MTPISRSTVLTNEEQPLLNRPVQRHIGAAGSQQKLEVQNCFASVLHCELKWVAVIVLLALATATFSFPMVLLSRQSKTGSSTDNSQQTLALDASWQQLCDDKPCFQKSAFCVPDDKPGFPSFWNYAPHGPIAVSYDERAILLNGTRSLLLGGSMHPARATHETWLSALDEAVGNGLNLITIYVFWSVHQPFPDSPYDWSLPGNGGLFNANGDDGAKVSGKRWDLATAIREAANRGFFVHARIGPYTCAEYSYGGIPDWVPLNKPNMSMRRPNQEWMDAMEQYLETTIRYLTNEHLWAHQGGPIILAQVENEIGAELDLETENINTMPDSNGHPRKATMQDYADWSGAVAAKYAPEVIWTMCNGLTARNTINTCNGYGGVSCSKEWLESYGQSGRIQVDQPALWTENEGGFQVWGETPEQSSYFWGRTARDFARDGLAWFARGGSHLNYYMWWGGYNRGQAAAGGITNMYASDAMLCPSGERRQPKFDHLKALHQTLIEIAPCVLESKSELLSEHQILIKGGTGDWEATGEQRMFVYCSKSEQESGDAVVFVENDSAAVVFALLRFPGRNQSLTVQGNAGVVLVNGIVVFDSASIDPRAAGVRRETTKEPAALLDWQSYVEPIGVDPHGVATQTHFAPIEQTQLMVSSRVSSDYAWYSTFFTVPQSMGVVRNATIAIESQRASAMSVYMNEVYINSEADPYHDDGNITFTIHIATLYPTLYSLSILSENFGYGNLIGRFGADTRPKIKGITGSVSISGVCLTVPCELQLVDGKRRWHSLAGLHGERKLQFSPHRHAKAVKAIDSHKAAWSRALFDTPSYDPNSQSLFLDITSGRGHLWLNGYDLGRYWNITRGETAAYTQRYYFLPEEYLYTSGQLNELTIFTSIGADHSATQLVLSELVADESARMEDLVAFETACI